MIRRPPKSTLLPYTTLSRSREEPLRRAHVVESEAEALLAGAERGARADQPRPAQRVQDRVGRHHRREQRDDDAEPEREGDRKSTRLNSSHANISYAVFCLKK